MKKVLFYPDPPIQLPKHSLSKTIIYFQIAGYDLTNDIDSDWDIAVHWTRMDDDKIRCEVPERLRNDKRLVLNRNLCDISKSYVDSVFTEVFGYSSMANTDAYGYCVRKSERQSAHDGEIVKTPCKREPGYVYQKLIDNRIAVDMVYDIRVLIFLGKIPIVFIKSKSVEGSFEHTKAIKKKYWVADVGEFITPEEQSLIISFCEKIGMDLGEIDALRDNSTGLLYLTDLNHTPGANIYRYIKDGDDIRDRLALFLRQQIERQ